MDLASAISNHLQQIEMDFKFELDSKIIGMKSAKKTRKGLPFGLSLGSKEEKDSPETIEDKGNASLPPKSRRSGGWASDTIKSAIRRSSSALFEQEQLDNKLVEEDNIPVIPNLDDYDDEKIAKAPICNLHCVSVIKPCYTTQDLILPAGWGSE